MAKRIARALAAAIVGVMLVLSWSGGTAETTEVLVTNSGDSVEQGESVCPDEELCTLRRAVEFANELPGEDRVVIRFDPDVFPPGEPATIVIEGAPLPAIVRDHVTIDGTGAGVVINGAGLGGHGISIGGAHAAAYGLSVRGFAGSCIHISGDAVTVGGAASAGNAFDDCDVGITVAADGVIIEGNAIGGSVPTKLMSSGILVQRGDARIGHESLTSRRNHIGNAVVGIRVGGHGEPTTANIRNNVFGRTPAGGVAPVLTGVEIAPPGGTVLVVSNQFANLLRGIIIVDKPGTEPSMHNTLRGNRFDNLKGIAIDFGPTGGRVPNDAGDADEGPNGLQNHPVFTRAAQAEVRGRVPGPCASCSVDLYFAERRGGPNVDVPVQPVAGGSTTTNAAGDFVLSNLPVSPGDWLMAIATDSEGNTSEFSEAVRVGSGIVQCGFETMHPGWNNLGYFGAPVSLGSVFPPGSTAPGPVRSIHRLVPGPFGNYESWFAANLFASTLTGVSTGQAYWFWADAEALLPGSFTLQEPLPVPLSAGWNQFVYIGAGETVENALASLGGRWAALYRWENDGDGGRWRSYGSPDTPAWVRSFDTMEPCAVYHILMTEDATLTPPQP